MHNTELKRENNRLTMQFDEINNSQMFAPVDHSRASVQLLLEEDQNSEFKDL